MKKTDIQSPIYRTINNHKWLLALMASLVAHGLLFVAVYWVWPSASSKGEGQVMLLESIHDETQIQPQIQAHKASKLSVQTQAQAKAAQPKGSTESVKPNPSLSQNQPQQNTQQQQKASSSNQGSLIDQSGKTQTPQDAYQQALLKHLLNKMGSAPVTGKADIQLSIISAGIAIEVQIKRIKGPVAYEQWLKSKVLNANPFPAIPKELGISQFKTTISIEHTSEP